MCVICAMSSAKVALCRPGLTIYDMKWTATIPPESPILLDQGIGQADGLLRIDGQRAGVRAEDRHARGVHDLRDGRVGEVRDVDDHAEVVELANQGVGSW